MSPDKAEAESGYLLRNKAASPLQFPHPSRSEPLHRSLISRALAWRSFGLRIDYWRPRVPILREFPSSPQSSQRGYPEVSLPRLNPDTFLVRKLSRKQTAT